MLRSNRATVSLPSRHKSPLPGTEHTCNTSAHTSDHPRDRPGRRPNSSQHEKRAALSIILGTDLSPCSEAMPRVSDRFHITTNRRTFAHTLLIFHVVYTPMQIRPFTRHTPPSQALPPCLGRHSAPLRYRLCLLFLGIGLFLRLLFWLLLLRTFGVLCAGLLFLLGSLIHDDILTVDTLQMDGLKHRFQKLRADS